MTETVEATTVDALNMALDQALQKDKDVLILGEDVGVDGGVFRVTKNLQKKYPGRVIDTPISEAGIVGSSIGLCIAGLRPVSEMQFSGFMAPGFQQLISHASRYRNRTVGALDMPMTVRAPMGGGIFALEHHSESLESIYAHIPGLKVVMCSRPYNAKGLLLGSIFDNNPVIFFEPKKIYHALKEKIPTEPYMIELGKADVVKEGYEITIVTYGAMLKTVLEVVNHIQDISIEVIDLQTIYPPDIDTIVTSVDKTRRLMVVNEARNFLNVASDIIVRVREKIDAIKTKQVVSPDTIVPLGKLEKYYIPSKYRIYKEILHMMGRKE